MTAIALTIAGSDSGGGAGIQADLKTFSALGVYGASVITALTAQNTRGVDAVFDPPPEFILAQISSVLSDLAVNTIKIGMLSSPATIRAVAQGLKRFPPLPIVFDPVMIAASGDSLLQPQAIEDLIHHLIPMADVLTPNLPEAARLCQRPVATTEKEIIDQGRFLLSLGAKAVLMKGGHAEGPEAVDFLIEQQGTKRYAHPRYASLNTHGTGCTLSSALAAGLAKGLALQQAVAQAKTYVSAAILAADRLKIGHGHGPTHHFHAFW